MPMLSIAAPSFNTGALLRFMLTRSIWCSVILLLLGGEARRHLLRNWHLFQQELHVLGVALAFLHLFRGTLRHLEGVHLVELVGLVVEHVRHGFADGFAALGL